MADEILGLVFLLVYLGVIIALIASYWKVFVKAGQPGWAAIIPIYNIYIFLKIVCRPGWWLILFIIPVVDIIVYIIVSIDIAKRFNKGTGFAIGLILLPIIFYPILGFGDATYKQCN
jgi:hypothetical protein